MKSTFLLWIFSFLWSQSFALIITVDNNLPSAGQYSDLQTAIDAATPGDTLHIVGSPIAHSTVNLTKKLTIIGAGYHSPNQLGLSTLLTSINITQNLPNNASGSVVMACSLTSIGWTGNGTYIDITIERCKTNSVNLPSNNGGNWIIQNNIIGQIFVGFNPNMIIRNNIITGAVWASSAPSVVIANNLFIRTAVTGNFFGNVSHAMINNNIFYGGGGPIGCSLSSFNNNLTFVTANDTLPYGDNMGTNNLIGMDPQFSAPNAPGFQFEDDYRLLGSSPASDAGTDGTDIGIYGGWSFPIGGPVPYLTSPPARIPQIEQLILLNGMTVFQGDSLKVQVKARKQN
ncbi:MAG: hypothetical protein AAF587_12420 [Bacteroidota bacterium]